MVDRKEPFLLPNHLTTGLLDRLAVRRRDEAWLAAQMENKQVRFVPVWQEKNLFTVGGIEPVYLAPEKAKDSILAAEPVVLLGKHADTIHFAVSLSSEEAPFAEMGRFQDLRRVAALLGEQDCALLALAKSMVYWHNGHRFCGACGSPTESREAGWVRVCADTGCGQHHFPRTDPAVIVLVSSGERCLLGHKPEWDEGRYSTIAGFVEPGESLEQAVAREVQEETGVEVEAIHYVASQPWPFPSSLMLGFRAQAASETIRIDPGELETARWFSREEIQRGLEDGSFRLPSSVSIARRLIRDWFDGGNCGKLEKISSLPDRHAV
jgi:NAD+ diphosphatase